MATRQRVDLTLPWIRSFLPILIGIACVGCVASLVLHTLAVFADGTWGFLSFLSIPVVIVVWFPTVCEANRLNRDPSGKPMFGMAYSRVFRWRTAARAPERLARTIHEACARRGHVGTETQQSTGCGDHH